MTHICVSKLNIIGSDNGLSPGRRQAIIWTNDGLLLIGPLGTNFSEISIEILAFSFKKMRLKVSSAKWRLFRFGLNVLRIVNLPVDGLASTNHVAFALVDWQVTYTITGYINVGKIPNSRNSVHKLRHGIIYGKIDRNKDTQFPILHRHKEQIYIIYIYLKCMTNVINVFEYHLIPAASLLTEFR